MLEMKNLMKTSLVSQLLGKGGAIKPLIIPHEQSAGLGLCNPSIYRLGDTTKYLINVRHVSYYLHHCEGDQKYQTPWGPLNYVRPDEDPHLRTKNYMCDFNLRNMELRNPREINTEKFTKEPEWDFVGLEDGRIVQWEGKTYMTGVRRYAPDGKGRMVLSEIEITKKGVKEVGRYIIDPPEGPDAYCEKNWMPILDKPFHYVKWSNPIEVVKVDVNPKWKNNPKKYRCPSTIVHKGDDKDKLDFQLDPRGSSQMINYKDGYLTVVHECDYWHNNKDDRDAHYYHRFMQYDKKFNLIGYSQPFKFMDGRIEFCCGMAMHPDGNDVYITFGFQDNTAYLVQVPGSYLEENLSLPEE